MTTCNSFKMSTATGKPVAIDPDIAETCYTLQGLCGSVPDLEVDDVVMLISRAGNESNPIISYPAFRLDDDGVVCFYWDDLLYDLPKGRYVGSININGNTVSQVQFEQGYKLSISKVTHNKRTHEVDCDD